MNIDTIVQKLINGETVVISNDEEAKIVQKRLRAIKQNCTIVLGQLKERLK